MSDAGIYLYQVETSKLANGLIDGEVFLVPPSGFAYPKDMHGYGYAEIGTLQFTPITFVVVDANADYSIGTLTFVPPSVEIGQGSIGTITISTIDGIGETIAYANAGLTVINVSPISGSALVAKYIPISTINVQEPIVTFDLTNDSGFQIPKSIYINGGGSYSLGANTIDIVRTVQYNITNRPANTSAIFSTWFKAALPYMDQVTILDDDQTYGNHAIRASGRKFYLSNYVFSWEFEAGRHDPTAWSHLVVAIDTTQSVEQNRIRLYLDGTRIPLTTQYGSMTQNYFNWLTLTPSQYGEFFTGSNTANVVQRVGVGSNYPDTNGKAGYNGLLADTYLITGVTGNSPAEYFGYWNSDTASWEPKSYSGSTPGPGSFHLTYSNPSNMGADSFGKGDFLVTPSAPTGNISFTDVTPQLPTAPKTWLFNDSPSRANTNPVLGNYCVWDISNIVGDGSVRVHDAALTGTCGIANTTNTAILGSYAVSSGKWYWEVRPFNHRYDPHYLIGVADIDAPGGTVTYCFPNGWWYQGNTGEKWNSNANTPYGSSYTTGDTVGVALDMDLGTVTFYTNNVSQGIAFSGLSGRRIAPAISSYRQQVTMAANFGQYSFEYTPPSGHKVLCSTNLPTPEIKNPTDHMEFVAYSGTGAQQNIFSTSVGYDSDGYMGGYSRADWQPDLVLLKSVDNTIDQLSPIMVYDSVRGGGVELNWGYNVNSSIEVVDANGVTSFIGGPMHYNAPGFSIGGNHLKINRANPATLDYRGWMFNKSPGAGLDIVSYTGTGSTQNIAHNLQNTPEVIMIKDRDGSSAWVMWHADAVKKYANTVVYLNVNNNNPWGNTTYFTATTPTTTQFTVGSHPWVNQTGHRYIAYLFKSIPGFSKFGFSRPYLGTMDPEGYVTSTGSTGFIHTEFSPKSVWLMRFSYPSNAPSGIYSDLYLFPGGPGAYSGASFTSGDVWDSSALPNALAYRNTFPGQYVGKYFTINSYASESSTNYPYGVKFQSNGFLVGPSQFLYFAWADASTKYARGRGI